MPSDASHSLLARLAWGLGVQSREGTATDSITQYRDYAADCVRRAQDEETVEDRTILLNVALAWVRLAQQVELRQDETVLYASEVTAEFLPDHGPQEMML